MGTFLWDQLFLRLSTKTPYYTVVTPSHNNKLNMLSNGWQSTINNKSNMNISGAAHHKGYFCVTPPWELWNLAHSRFALSPPATIMRIRIRLRRWRLARRWCFGCIPLVAPANSNRQIWHMLLRSEAVWLQIWHKMRQLSIKHSAL